MLQNIPVSNIVCLPNYRTIDTDNGEFLDLVKSVQKDGVLQPVLLRQHKTKKDQYELIFGNRRFAAAVQAGLTEVPAQIKQVADADILEFQVNENLQRKDVHPMDEAAAYKAYQSIKKIDVNELAAVFSKSERYITNRISLTNLIPELQKIFLKQILNVGQAEVFAKLLPAQQKELNNSTYQSYFKRYPTVQELKNKVQDMFLLKLTSASWSLTDKELLPKAGACNECKKRSGCYGLLFTDIVKDDRCMDAKCFAQKKELHFKAELENVAATKPMVKFLSYGKEDKLVTDIATKFNIGIINYYDSGISYSSSKGAVMYNCYCVGGQDKGTYKKVYISASSKSATKAGLKDNTTIVAVEAINARLTRFKELDYQKIQDRIVKELKEKAPDDKLIEVPENNTLVTGLLNFFLFDAYGYHFSDEELALYSLEETENFEHNENPDVLLQKLTQLNQLQVNNLIKSVFLFKYSSYVTPNAKTFVIRKIAEWFGVDINEIQKEFDAIATKRAANAAKKIEALQVDKIQKDAAKGYKKLMDAEAKRTKK